MAAITDDQIRECFVLFDTTESGTLTTEEFILAMNALGFGKMATEEANELMQEFTAAASGATEEKADVEGDATTTTTTTTTGKNASSPSSLTITLEAFADLVKATMAPKDSEAELQKAFGLFLGDSGKDSIDLELLLAVAQRLGQKDDESMLKEMIAEATADKKGSSISFGEFASVMTSMQGK